MTIGLPRAFLYYKYKYLWKEFFNALGCETIVSDETNIKTLTEGINNVVDESCLPTKIYMGHIKSLIGRCDYILVPRIQSFGNKEFACTKFYGIYDIVKNTFNDVPLIDYNINLKKGESELIGFVKMGKILNISCHKSIYAYKKAKYLQSQYDQQKTITQEQLLNTTNKLKLLIVSHPYITYDKMIGRPIIDYLKELGILPLYADAADKVICKEKSKNISKNIYWTFNKELIGSIEHYKEKIDGVLLLTAFPCGPDSLVNELVIRKYKTFPIINIVLDELQGDAGIKTRIESFIDILIDLKRRSQIEQICNLS